MVFGKNIHFKAIFVLKFSKSINKQESNFIEVHQSVELTDKQTIIELLRCQK